MRNNKIFSLFTFHFSLFVVPLHPQLKNEVVLTLLMIHCMEGSLGEWLKPPVC